MKTVAIILGLVVASYATNLRTRTKFNDFVEKYDKKYESPAHYHERLSIFSENLEMIEQHNREEHSWKMAVNHFADLSRKHSFYIDKCFRTYLNKTV